MTVVPPSQTADHLARLARNLLEANLHGRDFARAALSTLIDLTGAAAAYVVAPFDHTLLEITAAAPAPRQAWEHETIPVADSHADMATTQGRAVGVDEYAAAPSPQLPVFMADAGFRSGLAVPLPGENGHGYALVAVFTSFAGGSSPEVAHVLETVAGLLAMDNDRTLLRTSHEALQQRISEMARHAAVVTFRQRLDPLPALEELDGPVEEMTGISDDDREDLDDFLGRVIHHESRRSVQGAQQRGVDSRVPMRVRVADRKGRERYAALMLEFEHDSNGDAIAVQGSLRDITEEVRAETTLRRSIELEFAANDNLRELREMKTQFLEAISHELRTPLTAIMGYASTLNDHGHSFDDDGRQSLIEPIVTNARRLNALIADLLRIDRLEGDHVEPQRRATRVDQLVTKIIAEAPTGTRAVAVDLEEVEAMIDPPWYERLVVHLLSNAAKHTRSDGRIWIKLERKAQGCTLTVSDDGPGIADSLKELVFEAFRQGQNRRAEAPGVGIGLTMAMRVAAIHDGQCWIDDRDGGGAAVRVWVPLEAPTDR